jgi:prepilin-type N-terminal cleavage/methylation domain-containing protein
MIRNENGFSLVELIVAMVVFIFAIAAASQMFSGLLTQFKQQTKIAETNIEGTVGLEMLRRDIESAGYGLPTSGLVPYTESGTNPFNLNDAAMNPPKAMIGENNAIIGSVQGAANNIFNGSDYIVIKAANVATNDVAQKWTIVRNDGTVAIPIYTVTTWTPAGDFRVNFMNRDRVFVVEATGGSTPQKQLIADVAGKFYEDYQNIAALPWAPSDPNARRIVYGINAAGSSSPARPFNRADYFIRRFDAGGTNITPDRCAPNTGVFNKAVMNHDGAGSFTFLPLLDCVADFQVLFGLDTDGDGSIDMPPVDASVMATKTAQEIREQLKEVRAFVLAHEGQRDTGYDYPNTTIFVGVGGFGRTFDLTTIGDPEYTYYRWKLYTIVARPTSLR